MRNKRNVVVLGASDNPERFSHRAVKKLSGLGFPVIPVHPELDSVLGFRVIPSLSMIKDEVDTITVYLSPKRSGTLIDSIIALKPKKVVLNPGAENPELEKALDAAGIPWIHACTLVLLDTGHF